MVKDPYAISFGSSNGKREAFRARIPNVHVRINGRGDLIRVRDLSPTGMALDMSRGFKIGMNFSVTLYQGRTMVVEGLHVRVVRKEIGFSGLEFGLLSREQQDAVHRFCLAEQKRLADMRRADRYDLGDES